MLLFRLIGSLMSDCVTPFVSLFNQTNYMHAMLYLSQDKIYYLAYNPHSKFVD